jgi:16S rRNA processing protein RimM
MVRRFALMWWTAISSKTKLRVGRLVKAHGLKGAIKLELYTDSPDQRFKPGQVLELQVPETSEWFGKTVTVSELRFYNQAPVLFLEGVDDRSKAETLIKAILLIETDLDQLPEEPEAWYDHQLVGLKAMVGQEQVGVVSRVDHLPVQDLLAIETPNGEVLVPFVKQIVPEVDVKAGRVILTPPDGLFELNLESGAKDEN